MISIRQIEKWLGKRRMSVVKSIEIDSEVIEVVLLEGLVNTKYDETVWVWGLHHFECGSNKNDCRQDLISWFNSIDVES